MVEVCILWEVVNLRAHASLHTCKGDVRTVSSQDSLKELVLGPLESWVAPRICFPGRKLFEEAFKPL